MKDNVLYLRSKLTRISEVINGEKLSALNGMPRIAINVIRDLLLDAFVTVSVSEAFRRTDKHRWLENTRADRATRMMNYKMQFIALPDDDEDDDDDPGIA